MLSIVVQPLSLVYLLINTVVFTLALVPFSVIAVTLSVLEMLVLKQKIGIDISVSYDWFAANTTSGECCSNDVLLILMIALLLSRIVICLSLNSLNILRAACCTFCVLSVYIYNGSFGRHYSCID